MISTEHLASLATVTELRANTTALLGQTRRGPIGIQKNNRLEAVLVSAGDYARLKHFEAEAERLRRRAGVIEAGAGDGAGARVAPL